MGRPSRKLWGVALMFVAGVVLSIFGFMALRTSRRLAAEGVLTGAHVVGKHTERARRSLRRYLDEEYRTNDGEVIRGSDRVSADRFRRAKVGEVVSVNHLPSDPDVHALGRKVQPDYALLFLAADGVRPGGRLRPLRHVTGEPGD